MNEVEVFFQPEPSTLAGWVRSLADPEGSEQSAADTLAAAGALLLAEEELTCVEHHEAIRQAAQQARPEAAIDELEARLSGLERLAEREAFEIPDHVLALLLTRHRVHLYEQALLLAHPTDLPWDPKTEKRLETLDERIQRWLSRVPTPVDATVVDQLREPLERELELVHPHNRQGMWWLMRLLDGSSAAPSLPAAGEVTREAESAPTVDAQVATLRRLKIPRFPLAMVAVALLVLGGGAAWRVVLQSQEQAERDRTALIEQMQRAEEEQRQVIRALQDKLASTESMSEAQRQALQAELEQARDRAQAARVTGGQAVETSNAAGPASCAPDDQACVERVPPSTMKSKPHSSSCPPGDPMCGGL